MDYQQFLESKLESAKPSGFEVALSDINPKLFDWQKEIVRWGLRRGRAALFEECGLGKTAQELAWADAVSQHEGKPVLLLTPLAVAQQTIAEAEKFNIQAEYRRSQGDVGRSDRIVVANYEMVRHFDPTRFAGVVVDESSILKNYTGMTKRLLMTMFAETRYKLAPSATPAPNDYLELGNQCAFIGDMDSNEMIARFFINDSMEAGGYRLKGHAASEFWRFVAGPNGWAVGIERPSDLGSGYSDVGFERPELNVVEHRIPVDHTRAHAQGRLMLDGKMSATNMWREKRYTLNDRLNKALEIVASAADEAWIIWCDTDEESAALAALIPGSVEVLGSQNHKIKAERLRAFSEGRIQKVILKGKIGGFGLNWQHCRNQLFVGLTFSFEMIYQMLRRSWRRGSPWQRVNAHFIIAETEDRILETIQRKEEQHREMMAAMRHAMAGRFQQSSEPAREVIPSISNVARGRDWTLYLGDCVTELGHLVNDSIDFSVFSPPFALIYIYSALLADIGNCADMEEFKRHYAFMCAELTRVMKPGAVVAVHCKDLPLYANRDGAMGLSDFPGDLIRAHEESGLFLVDWITIWKDPVIEMQRTKNAGLLWGPAFCERAERARQGMADYVLIFEKRSKALTARPHKALGIEALDRCCDLWANRGERVISPLHDITGDSQAGLIIWDEEPAAYTPEWIESWLLPTLMDGRLLVTHICDPREMHPIISLMSEYRMVFHSRVALTDGTWLVVFRKWVDNMPDTHVTHDLKAETHRFIGRDGPIRWDSDRDYSIQVWQRYASPVWFDLEDYPDSHPNILMGIQQTNVLNNRVARDNEDEKHICPLQLDLIAEMLRRYSNPGDLVLSPFAGIGSEGYKALEMGRRFVGVELKESYWLQATKFLQEMELSKTQLSLFGLEEWAA